MPADTIFSPVQSSASPVLSGDLTVRIEEDFLSLENLRSLWDETVAQLGGSIHLTYDWARTWWEFYGAGRKLRIFLFYTGDRLVGIAPIYIDCIGIKPLQISVARLVCSNIPPKTFNPPIHPDWAGHIFESIVTRLLDRDQCDLISIGPVSESFGTLQRFEAAAPQHGSPGAAVSRETAGVHTIFRLPGTMDQFFEAIEKDERKKRKYELRLLAKEADIARDVISDPDRIEAEFEAFSSLHALQWRDKGKLGHFGSWPAGKPYNLKLVKTLAKLGRVRFVRIVAAGQVISNQLAFVFGNTWYWELPARATEKKWNRFSLGTTGFFSLVEEAIKEGCSRIEGGVAHYDYKQKLNGTEFSLEILRIVSGRPGSKLRVRLFGWLRALLQLAYYKIWYSRVSPRLPAAFRKPLWPFWLRLDF
jgi:CelD/BcsL family acetyltransferase involved in cellulose biosynthesis